MKLVPKEIILPLLFTLTFTLKVTQHESSLVFDSKALTYPDSIDQHGSGITDDEMLSMKVMADYALSIDYAQGAASTLLELIEKDWGGKWAVVILVDDNHMVQVADVDGEKWVSFANLPVQNLKTFATILIWKPRCSSSSLTTHSSARAVNSVKGDNSIDLYVGDGLTSDQGWQFVDWIFKVDYLYYDQWVWLCLYLNQMLTTQWGGNWVVHILESGEYAKANHYDNEKFILLYNYGSHGYYFVVWKADCASKQHQTNRKQSISQNTKRSDLNGEKHGDGLSSGQVTRILRIVDQVLNYGRVLSDTAQLIQVQVQDAFGGAWGVNVLFDSEWGQAANITDEKWIYLSNYGYRKLDIYIWKLQCLQVKQMITSEEGSSSETHGKAMTDEQAKQFEQWIISAESESKDIDSIAMTLKHKVDQQWGSSWVVSIFGTLPYGRSVHMNYLEYILFLHVGSYDWEYYLWKTRC